MGFDFTSTSRDIDSVSKRFISKLLNETSPIKQEYQSTFNHKLLPKKDIIPEHLKVEINDAWQLQFNEERIWEKVQKEKDRTLDWKDYRNNKQINPEGKWFTTRTKMGELYSWVKPRKNKKYLMELIIGNFDSTEKTELINEGFPI